MEGSVTNILRLKYLRSVLEYCDQGMITHISGVGVVTQQIRASPDSVHAVRKEALRCKKLSVMRDFQILDATIEGWQADSELLSSLFFFEIVAAQN